MQRDPILVVGTTPDYVARIYEDYPQPTIFIIDPKHRDDSRIKGVARSALLFNPLETFDDLFGAVSTYLAKKGRVLRGVGCFDCEYLILASRLANHLRLPFPSREAIVRARNKFESKRIWTAWHVPSPLAALSASLEDTVEFFRRVRKPIILKPVSASGSELLFHCENERDIVDAVRVITDQLPKRRSNPLYGLLPCTSGFGPIDPTQTWIAEEFIAGPEFSCDFILQDGTAVILRETGKEKSPTQTFGSILAYTFPPTYPEGFSAEALPEILRRAANALGFTWGHFMVDFIIQDGRPVILEMTPRPGGDSIPDLIKTATGADLIGIYLDVMSGNQGGPRKVDMPPESLASINFYTPREGIIKIIDPSRILDIPWVRGVVLKKNVGDTVSLPPHDYDNRLLGYCIVSVKEKWNPIAVSEYLQNLLSLSFTDSPPGMTHDPH